MHRCLCHSTVTGEQQWYRTPTPVVSRRTTMPSSRRLDRGRSRSKPAINQQQSRTSALRQHIVGTGDHHQVGQVDVISSRGRHAYVNHDARRKLELRPMSSTDIAGNWRTRVDVRTTTAVDGADKMMLSPVSGTTLWHGKGTASASVSASSCLNCCLLFSLVPGLLLFVYC